MRTRDEVLAAFGANVPSAQVVSMQTARLLADHVSAIEQQRDEYHRLYKAEVLAKRELADRIRELEARGVPEANFGNVQPEAVSGEPVAWAFTLRMGNGAEETHIVTKAGDVAYYRDLKHMIRERPLVFGYAPPSAAGDLRGAAQSLIDAYNNQRSDSEKDAAWMALARAVAHPSAAAVNSHQSVPSDYPSAAAVTVTEAMVEAAWKELRVQCIPDGPSLVDCVDRDDLRSAITAALTAASEVQP